jgi:putative isomerase
MVEILTSPSLNLLRNQLDFTRVPFSDRGSRLLVFLNSEKSNVFIRLAERLASLEANLEAYIRRPPFIHDLTLIDGSEDSLMFETTTYPHVIFFNTDLGDFGLTFLDDQTLALGLPPGKTTGIKFHVSWRRV